MYFVSREGSGETRCIYTGSSDSSLVTCTVHTTGKILYGLKKFCRGTVGSCTRVSTLDHTIHFDLRHDKTQQFVSLTSDDPEQPEYLPSLIRVFAGCMKKAWVFSYQFSAQQQKG